MLSAWMAVTRTKFSKSARFADNWASWLCRCERCLFLALAALVVVEGRDRCPVGRIDARSAAEDGRGGCFEDILLCRVDVSDL